MSHLKGIGFENFRVFQNKTYFEFAPLTILTGTNSSGKSSVINGLKLLAESFKSIRQQSSNEGNILNLDTLLLEPLDMSKILERYGGLTQFLNHSSTKKEFSFSFIQTPPILNEELEFIYTVCIENNKLKTGRVKEIEIRAVNEDKVVFRIYEIISPIKESSRELKKVVQHAFKVDLYYFYLKFEKTLEASIDYYKSRSRLNTLIKDSGDMNDLQEAINQHNNVYNDDCYWSTFDDIDGTGGIAVFNNAGVPDGFIKYQDIFTTLLKEYTQGMHPYDFSFLWQEGKQEEMKFHQAVKTYFEVADGEGDYALQYCILQVLSAVEWKADVSTDPLAGDYPSNDFYIQFPKHFDSNTPPPFSLQMFITDFVFGGAYFFDGFEDADWQSMVTNAFKKASVKNIPFIDEVLTTLLIALSKSMAPSWSIENRESTFFLSTTEKYFYNGFLYEVLSHITKPIASIKEFTFVDAQRIQPKRLFSITQADLFSTQVRTLFRQPDWRFERSLEFLNRWICEFNIADEITFRKDEDTENFKVYLHKSGAKPVLLADYGFGTSQILPIIIAMIPIPNTDYSDPYEHAYLPQLICVEEPENSLHPALQSKLGDMFVEAITRFNIQLIIETHSEYLIRKLQYLTAVPTALNKLSPSFTQIYYFHHPDHVPEQEKQIRKINIKKDGFLTKDFGEGFFDESGRLMIELLKLQNEN